MGSISAISYIFYSNFLNAMRSHYTKDSAKSGFSVVLWVMLSCDPTNCAEIFSDRHEFYLTHVLRA